MPEGDLWQILLEESIGHILATGDYDSFIEMLNTSPVLDPLFDDVPEGGRATIAHNMGRAIWNATPLPGNRFRPRHRLPPDSGKPCPCGSGLKYRQCCEPGPRHPPLDPGLAWSIAWSMFSEAEKQAALESRAIPVPALPTIAQAYLDDRHPGKARDLLEPLVQKPAKVSADTLAQAVEVLSEAYRDLGHHRKRRSFLEQLAETSRGPVLVAVVGQLCPLLADAEDWDEAWRLHGKALRAMPDDPMLAMQEVTMLYAQGRPEEAGMRAKFWHRRMGTRLPPDHPAREALDRVVANPGAGLLAMAGDDALQRLRQTIDTGLSRPALVHELVDEDEPVDDSNFEASIRAHFRGMGMTGEDLEQVVANATEDFAQGSAITGLEADPDEAGDDPEDDDSAWLKATTSLARVEERWRGVYPGSKPFSISFEPFGEADPWAPEASAQWLKFLEDNPAAFDSLEILDDLATALYAHPAMQAGALTEMFADVVRRGVDVLDRTLAECDDALPQLPWQIVANRPALRLLAHHIHLVRTAGQTAEAVHRLEQYLILSPGDSHGFRGFLIEHHLRAGDDESALEIAARFPDDILVETSMGRVLALYRLGRLEEAVVGLASTHRNNPYLIEMLINTRVKKPRIDQHGIRVGGPDQAWLYRESMRPVWQATPGAIEWLEQQRKGLEPQR